MDVKTIESQTERQREVVTDLLRLSIKKEINDPWVNAQCWES